MILFNTLNNPSIPYCEGNDIYTRNTEYYLLVKKNYIIFQVYMTSPLQQIYKAHMLGEIAFTRESRNTISL